jgi:tRNA acetyltransferase TAN1
MIKDFNIIATTDKINESRACSELWMLLKATGDESPTVDRSFIRGIVVGRTCMAPDAVSGRLLMDLRNNPKNYNALYRIIPVQRIIETSTEKIVEAAKVLAKVMRPGDSFRVTFEKRRTGLSSHETIDAVASHFDQRVDLKNPDWVILIETIGKITGVSVVKPSQIMNVQKTRFSLSTEKAEGTPLNDQVG